MLINHYATESLGVQVKKNQVNLWLKWGLALVGLGLLWWFRQPVAHILGVIGDREAVSAYLQAFGITGPLLLGLILVLQVIIATIPGHVLMVSGGYVYGFGLAFWVNLMATVGGSQAAFLLARWAGRPVVERLAPTDALEKWGKVSAEKGLVFFLFAFMLPVFPSDVMNYVAGMSSISSRHFFIANLFGRLPGVVLLTTVGAYGFELSGWIWLLVLVAAGVMFVAWWYTLARERSNIAAEE